MLLCRARAPARTFDTTRYSKAEAFLAALPARWSPPRGRSVRGEGGEAGDSVALSYAGVLHRSISQTTSQVGRSAWAPCLRPPPHPDSSPHSLGSRPSSPRTQPGNLCEPASESDEATRRSGREGRELQRADGQVAGSEIGKRAGAATGWRERTRAALLCLAHQEALVGRHEDRPAWTFPHPIDARALRPPPTRAPGMRACGHLQRCSCVLCERCAGHGSSTVERSASRRPRGRTVSAFSISASSSGSGSVDSPLIGLTCSTSSAASSFFFSAASSFFFPSQRATAAAPDAPCRRTCTRDWRLQFGTLGARQAGQAGHHTHQQERRARRPRGRAVRAAPAQPRRRRRGAAGGGKHVHRAAARHVLDGGEAARGVLQGVPAGGGSPGREQHHCASCSKGRPRGSVFSGSGGSVDHDQRSRACSCCYGTQTPNL